MHVYVQYLFCGWEQQMQIVPARAAFGLPSRTTSFFSSCQTLVWVKSKSSKSTSDLMDSIHSAVFCAMWRFKLITINIQRTRICFSRQLTQVRLRSACLFLSFLSFFVFFFLFSLFSLELLSLLCRLADEPGSWQRKLPTLLQYSLTMRVPKA